MRQLGNVVLGFLFERARHGYELKRTLSPALPRTKQVNDGVLYPLLRKLEEAGLIRGTMKESKAARARRVFQLTRAGKVELDAWLRDQSDEADDVSYDFMIGHPFLAKCMFFDHLDEEEINAKIEAQLEGARGKLATFERIRDGMRERSADPWRVAILELGISQQRVKIRWLRSLPDVAAARSIPPKEGKE